MHLCGVGGIYRAAALCKVVELQTLSEGIGPRDAGPGDLPAIQSGMRVATAVTFQNTGSEARRRLAAAAAAAVAAKPLVRGGGNLTIDASVICKASGSGAADSGTGTQKLRHFLFPSGAAPCSFFFLPLDD